MERVTIADVVILIERVSNERSALFQCPRYHMKLGKREWDELHITNEWVTQHAETLELIIRVLKALLPNDVIPRLSKGKQDGTDG
jgi:hypothetical protein